MLEQEESNQEGMAHINRSQLYRVNIIRKHLYKQGNLTEQLPDSKEPKAFYRCNKIAFRTYLRRKILNVEN